MALIRGDHMIVNKTMNRAVKCMFAIIVLFLFYSKNIQANQITQLAEQITIFEDSISEAHSFRVSNISFLEKLILSIECNADKCDNIDYLLDVNNNNKMDLAESIYLISSLSKSYTPIPQSLTITCFSSNHDLISKEHIQLDSLGLKILENNIYFLPENSIPADISIVVMPERDRHGTALIKLSVIDSLNFSNFTEITVVVNPVNDEPTIDQINNQFIKENSKTQKITLTGISDGDPMTNSVDKQAIEITAISSNPKLIPNPRITYTSESNEGLLEYSPVMNANGESLITVTVHDTGGTENSGINQTSISFNISVTPINEKPTIDEIDDQSIIENSGSQTIQLSGITDGDPMSTEADQQFITITAVSGNPELIPNPKITYLLGSNEGLLEYTPIMNANGESLITVTVYDTGGTENGGINQTSISFNICITPINEKPTIDEIDDQSIIENSGLKTIQLSGITDGDPMTTDADQQFITITAVSSNPELLPNPKITYLLGSNEGLLEYTPALNANGESSITVTVYDSGGTENGGVNQTSIYFNISVIPVNNKPTIDKIADQLIKEDSEVQIIQLSGITDGDPGHSEADIQKISITATSNNEELIQKPAIFYYSPNSEGTLYYQPIPNRNGSAIITVEVKDETTISNNSELTTISFQVQVVPVNDIPTIDLVPNETIKESSKTKKHIIELTGITDGDPWISDADNQSISLSVISSDQKLIPKPTISYIFSADNAILEYTPTPMGNGSATITITVQDQDDTVTPVSSELTKVSFKVQVTPINNLPTIDSVPNEMIDEDSGEQIIQLTGIDDGDPWDSEADTKQNISLSVISSNQKLIPNPMITYSSPNENGVLKYTPVKDGNGVAMITITVQDKDNTVTPATSAITRVSFEVQVTPVNDFPTIGSVPNETIIEDSGEQIIQLTGIDDGDPWDSQADLQQMTITAISNNQNLMYDPKIEYISPNTTGFLKFSPVENASGEATITISVHDNGLINNIKEIQFSIDILADPDPPFLTVNEYEKGEDDTPIDLYIEKPLLADTDDSETITYISVFNVPEKATLSAGVRVDGVWFLKNEDLPGLTLTPSRYDDYKTIKLRLEVSSIEINEQTKATTTKEITVDITKQGLKKTGSETTCFISMAEKSTHGMVQILSYFVIILFITMIYLLYKKKMGLWFLFCFFFMMTFFSFDVIHAENIDSDSLFIGINGLSVIEMLDVQDAKNNFILSEDVSFKNTSGFQLIFMAPFLKSFFYNFYLPVDEILIERLSDFDVNETDAIINKNVKEQLYNFVISKKVSTRINDSLSLSGIIGIGAMRTEQKMTFKHEKYKKTAYGPNVRLGLRVEQKFNKSGKYPFALNADIAYTNGLRKVSHYRYLTASAGFTVYYQYQSKEIIGPPPPEIEVEGTINIESSDNSDSITQAHVEIFTGIEHNKIIYYSNNSDKNGRLSYHFFIDPELAMDLHVQVTKPCYYNHFESLDAYQKEKTIFMSLIEPDMQALIIIDETDKDAQAVAFIKARKAIIRYLNSIHWKECEQIKDQIQVAVAYDSSLKKFDSFNEIVKEEPKPLAFFSIKEQLIEAIHSFNNIQDQPKKIIYIMSSRNASFSVSKNTLESIQKIDDSITLELLKSKEISLNCIAIGKNDARDFEKLTQQTDGLFEYCETVDEIYEELLMLINLKKNTI